jgi:hypothetical protein
VAPQGATGARGGWVSSSSGLYDCLQTTAHRGELPQTDKTRAVRFGRKWTKADIQ